jgi:hypothetical protein
MREFQYLKGGKLAETVQRNARLHVLNVRRLDRGMAGAASSCRMSVGRG